MRFKSLSIVVFMLLLMLAPLYMMTAPAAAESPTTEGPDPNGAGTLTLLHNNDGESALLANSNNVAPGTGYPNTDTVSLDVGSVAAFKSVMDREITDAEDNGNAVVTVYAGDAFLASATLACSINNPDIAPYDSVAQRQMDYDAHVFGNHEFDYGPDFLQRFIEGFDVGDGLMQPFLSANLDFSDEMGFADLIDADGVIVDTVMDGDVVAKSLIMTKNGQRFGVVGATTWGLANISSPRNVMVTSSNLTDTATVVQEAIDVLSDTHGVRKIILVSHLQDVDNDADLIELLSGVDVAVAGGGDELLVSSTVPTTTQVLPGTESDDIGGTYPMEVMDSDGRTVYLVTSEGNYTYLGRLDVEFDAMGEVSNFVAESSYPRRVIPQSDVATDLGLTDTVMMDADIVTSINDPIEACLADLENTPIAATEVLLDVSRDTVRGSESNAGNLVADGFIYIYEQHNISMTHGVETPVIALQNGGGIRQNAGDTLPTTGIAPGTISQRNTIDVLPFYNLVTMVEGVTPAELKSILEHSGDDLPEAGGQFMQMSGLHVTYNYDMEVGSRVMTAMLTDGTMIVENGAVADGAPDVAVITNSFVAGGGDGYSELGDNPNKTNLLDGNDALVTYEQAFREYLLSFSDMDGLPTVPDDAENFPAYQPGGEGRITITGGVTAVEMAELDANRSSAPLMPLALGMMVMIGFGFVAIWQRRSR